MDIRDFDISEITGLTQDSRAVKDGYLFAAFAGERVDGRDFIDQAIANGARYILAPLGTAVPDGAVLVAVENPRHVFAKLVAEFYVDQPARIVAVTGTNGKTSVVNFVEQIWTALGVRSASLGTLSGKMTTADPVSLHVQLAALDKDGVTHLAMEASSHGLDQYRLDGVNVQAAGFTNLSRDHLDYHKTMDAYLMAKSRLFSDVIGDDGVAVLNADVAEYQALVKVSKGRVVSYGEAGDSLSLMSVKPLAQGQEIELKYKNDAYRIKLNLVGRFQVMNVLCALGLVLSEDGIDVDKAINALSDLHGVAGRLQHVAGHPAGAGVYVDYAHTPDALETVLKTLRPHVSGRLLCVFGCGGDRDAGKRSQMGAIAGKLADDVIITDDNPRSEDPALIRSAILDGARDLCPDVLEIGDRREAIGYAVSQLGAGDVLLVAGKGHEQGQIFATHVDAFDDVLEVKTAFEKNLEVMKEEAR